MGKNHFGSDLGRAVTSDGLSPRGNPMQHLTPERIDLYARRGVSEAKDPEIEAHLAGCSSCKSRLADAVSFARALPSLQRQAAEMRLEHRYPTDDPAILQVLNPEAPGRWKVRIRDVSRGGMCVMSPKPIDRGAQVTVQRGTSVAWGEIRYCVQIGEVFQAGILLREVR
jgi:hypothetical protein